MNDLRDTPFSVRTKERWTELRIFVIFTCILAALGTAPRAERLVAIADIHGDYDAFVQVLKRARLVDSKLKWSGGTTTLVQTGDFVDRGPKTRAVMDLLMDLQKQAGGRVIVLLGNHEVLNIIGDLRNVVAADYASFADERSERRRRTAYESYAALEPSPIPESQWKASHPPGFIEHREAFGPNGRYGRWLRTLPAVAQVDDTIFVHGGISPALADWTVKRINESISGELRLFDAARKYMVDEKIALPFDTLPETVERANAALKAAAARDAGRRRVLEAFLGIGSWLGVHPEGPLWFRGYANWSDEDGEGFMLKLTEAYGVRRFVVGHTVQAGGSIRSRFGDRVFLIDTGMLAGYYEGGRGSALEIAGGTVTPIYP